MKTYNGHRSWNAWNVSLWLNNDYGMYHYIVDTVKSLGIRKAVRVIFRDLEGQKAPDGAIYNRLSIKLAIEGMEIEQD